MMHVSLFEVWKITQRCLEAAGVPAGHDREGAFATMWLAEHGFPGIVMVSTVDLSTGADWSLSLSRTESATQLDAAGLPLVSLGVDAIDLAVADAVSNVVELTVVNACAPLYLIPFAARRTHQSGTFTLRWEIAGDAICATVSGEQVWIDGGNLDTLNDVTTRCDAKVIYDPQGNSGAPVGQLLTAQQIDTRRQDCLAHGTEVDKAQWAELVQMSRAVLVPDSAESREHGAGGGDAND
ncbi:MAG: DUF3726 domain-containing protein [Rhodospirillales bacterium]|jgi:hypothetical protein|nr:DUF3726 domain-containing protein [Rhodospirillales bacterium]MBT4040956.1 DUF3726 domain-containing protein [Rhodospirillales bacterium]MBT4625642.1 DUF3726 domain-containing protein [Rhodospirillales bacterium]MBT5350189.1 DUF3726 domain-containing protein [Rhodospirillales bacterium]MBT5522029.1 DUF3726 domain-containing protein [Rhodospirillales bacterium]